MLGGLNTEIHIAFKNISVEPAIRQFLFGVCKAQI